MFYSDCFTAAKRITLALDSLIRSKYPRDTLHIIGFSYLAEELKPTDLPTLTWNEYQYGTNMQHGFQLARQILGREKGSNRQIIIITDGEPTAHMENGQVSFHWPPMPRTFQETLREVVRCTRDNITINTFMLERSPYMVQFVNQFRRSTAVGSSLRLRTGSGSTSWSITCRTRRSGSGRGSYLAPPGRSRDFGDVTAVAG